MSTRKKASVILCVVFVILTSLLAALANYISTGGHPGINSASFAPAEVINVSDEEDILVTVYPTGGMLPHGTDRDICLEVPLNSINKGWIVVQYQGKCRLLFEINDANMEDFCGIGDNKHYYYAEIIPSQRLRITDITARHKDEPTDPFAKDTRPTYLNCCINEERSRFNFPRRCVRYCIVADTGFILLVIGVNLIINTISKHKTKGK